MGMDKNTLCLFYHMYLNSYLKTSKNYGMAGAISVIIFIITGLLSLVVYRSLTKRDD